MVKQTKLNGNSRKSKRKKLLEKNFCGGEGEGKTKKFSQNNSDAIKMRDEERRSGKENP